MFLFPTSTVARKILMAVTGQMMLLFVILHVLGNSTIYFDRLINAYAASLHAMPALLWAVRFFMGAMLCCHAYFGVIVTLENHKAKPLSYAVAKSNGATFAGKNMIWTGTVIGAFLIFHLLHFTAQVIDPRLSAGMNPDVLGRPDVFMMVVQNFQYVGIAAVYVLGVLSLGLHLLHGVQSSVQTWGANNDQSLPVVRKIGTIAAVVLFLGYAAIPVVIVSGMLK